jgi:hypothetical protein
MARTATAASRRGPRGLPFPRRFMITAMALTSASFPAYLASNVPDPGRPTLAAAVLGRAPSG